MQEIELKFQVPPDARAAVAAAMKAVTAHDGARVGHGGDDVDGTSAGSGTGDARDGASDRTPEARTPRRTRLQASYFDTAQRTLACAGLALRVRRENGRWVQTLKGQGDDGMTRDEHNVVLPVSAANPAGLMADPALHADTAVGRRLLTLLTERAQRGEDVALVCRWRTDIWRRSRRVTTASGTVELAFDEGAVFADGQRIVVCELEIELIGGSAEAVIATARDWLGRHPLWLDTRSKAERGDLLARGEAMAPACHAEPVSFAADATLAQALRAALAGCNRQIAVNASQVASGQFTPEHLHQLRVGLRRLRSAWRLFDADAVLARAGAGGRAGDAAKSPDADADADAGADAGAGADVASLASALFRQLGGARDADAVGGPLTQALTTAMRAAAFDGEPPRLPVPAPVGDASPAPPDACVRSADAQRLLLALIAALQRLGAVGGVDDHHGHDNAKPLRERAGKVLGRWHRQVAAMAKRFATLDDEARHTLRKRVKRLRYAVEFVAPAFRAKAVKAYLKPLRRLQERLGSVNDTAVGLDAFRPSAAHDPRAGFALGWLVSRREALLADCAPALHAFAEVRRFWR